jgi:hypothetical protein
MVCGMASYVRNGEVEAALATQKQYLSLYTVRTEVLNAHRDQLTGLDVTMGASDIAGPARSSHGG